MKKAFRVTRIIIISTALIYGSTLSYRMFNHILTPTSFQVAENNMLSTEAHNQLTQFIKQETDYAHSSLKNIAFQIKDKFPFISTTAISHIPTKLLVTVEMKRPLFVINNEFILFSSGLLEKKGTFNKEIVETLPSITVNKTAYSNNQLIPACQTCMSTINLELVNTYQFFWKNEREVWLEDKQLLHFAILADLHSLKDKVKLDHCRELKKKLLCKKSAANKESDLWIADIRFDNQIVIFSRGGRDHGYYTFT